MGKWLKAVAVVFMVFGLAVATNAYAAEKGAAAEGNTAADVGNALDQQAKKPAPPTGQGGNPAFQVVAPGTAPISHDAVNANIREAFSGNIYPLVPSVTTEGIVTLNLGKVDGKNVTVPSETEASFSTAKAAIEKALTSAVASGRISGTDLTAQEIPLLGGEALGLAAKVDANGNVTAVQLAEAGRGSEERAQRGYLTVAGVNFLLQDNAPAIEALLVRELTLRQRLCNREATDNDTMDQQLPAEKTALEKAGQAVLAEVQRRTTETLEALGSTITNGVQTHSLTQGGANAAAILGADVWNGKEVTTGQTGFVISTKSVFDKPGILGIARGLANQGISVTVVAEGDQKDVVAASATAAGLSIAENAQAAIALMPADVLDIRYIRTDSEAPLAEEINGKRVVSIIVKEVLASIGKKIQGIDAWFSDIQLRQQAFTQK